MDQHLALRVAGTDDGLRLAAETFDRFRAAQGVPFTAAWKLQVALDEVLSNLVRYAYADKRGGADIELEFGFRRGIVTVTVIDTGPRFNPLDAPPRTDRPLEPATSVGLGVAYIRSLTDEARYEWRDGRNVLTIALYVQA